ncbi:hypothetical protein KHS38_11865 [Mucilaginibacter sp. Bleaf8]|uniref:hypothetical protein n=1 Tax=Mucilaginibacter sp. Bleaf8 TaxID=2834430 RepID=UPI001BCCE735|nr:hypothetical protein [Mucilaginibacter sp. Bleaf8]MBS7565102.1 hypothetical protein [Mucilaginibacter sp. Bleaf8]
MITDFPSIERAYLPGLVSFAFIPSQYIQTLPPVSQGTITQLVKLRSADRFLNGLSVIRKLSFDEEGATDDNGTIYNWKVTGFYPGDDPAAAALFAEMEADHIRHLVIAKDHAGRRRLIGYNAPLTFTAVFNSGIEPGDAIGYTFTFTGRGKQRAPLYKA